MAKNFYEYGMIGLGTMGRNLVYNMNDHGFSVAGFDKDKSKVDAFMEEGNKELIKGFDDVNDFINALSTPRVIFLLVPAGKIVDDVIDELKPLLNEQDLVVDCGNSHFTDTNRRIEKLSKEKLRFMGIGISGGESGARKGPSIMPGGSEEDYRRISSVLESIAAKVYGEPCVIWLGPGSAGHYVKMVHNGIEYGIMQLIAETYHILKEAGDMNNDEIHEVFSLWNKGRLLSYLVGITADIFSQKDDLTGNYLVDVILDKAQQNGTGAWTSEDAMALQIPIPVIDIAVTMRNISALKQDRVLACKILAKPEPGLKPVKNELIDELEQALYFAMVTTYAQGLVLLKSASQKYNFGLKLDKVAKIWRGGCIIRAELLEDISAGYAQNAALSNLMMDMKFAKKLSDSQKGIRRIVQTAAQCGIPVATYMASLAYYDSYRSEWLPTNLIQAQRDYFGAHTYKRNDREGVFHTHWILTQE